MGERGGSVVECRTPEREVRGSRPTAAVLCPWARHFTPRKYWLITQEAMAPSRHDWKIVDWDVKPQHNQPTNLSTVTGHFILWMRGRSCLIIKRCAACLLLIYHSGESFFVEVLMKIFCSDSFNMCKKRLLATFCVVARKLMNVKRLPFRIARTRY